MSPMSDTPPNSTASASEVAAFLRDRDIQCPSCGVSLRGVATDVCPSCGTALTLAALRTAPGAGLPGAIFVVRVISAIAMGIALYLAYNGIANKQPAGCSGDGGCSHVLGSRWSSLWGVPVSVPAVLVYLGIFLATFHVSPALPQKRRRDGWLVLLVLATMAGLGALWFIALQAFVLQAYCPYCMLDHLCGLVVATLVLMNAPIWPAKAPATVAAAATDASAPPLLAPAKTCVFLATAALAVALLATAQVVFPADTHAVKRFTDANASSTNLPTKDGAIEITGKDASSAKDAAKDAAAPPDGENPADFVMLNLPKGPKPNGAVRLSKAAFPLRGGNRAKFTFVVLADYTCPHCKHLHHHVSKAAKRYGDQVAFLILPMPLDSKCNPFVLHTDDRHYFACELARLALAVWHVDAEKFADYDDWLFNAPGELSRTDREARREAERLIGKEALDKAIASGVPDDLIKKTAKVYDLAGLGRIPKLMYGEFRIEGPMTEDSLWRILEDKESLGLVPVK